jgi:hypothetical protein
MEKDPSSKQRPNSRDGEYRNKKKERENTKS